MSDLNNPNIATLFSELKPEVTHLFSALKEKYEYIIIDTAPIKAVSDTLELLSKVDMSLFVIKEDVFTDEHTHAIHQVLKAHPSKQSGILVNHMKNYKIRYGYKTPSWHHIPKQERGFSKLLEDLKTKVHH